MLHQCQFPGCTVKIPARRKYCDPHREEINQQIIKNHNRKVSLQRQERRKLNPILCREEGCSNPVEKPRDHRCPECKAKMAKEKSRQQVVFITESKPVPVERWMPKPKPAPIMTDAEQRRIDADITARLNARCGYGHGPVKRYSKAEIAALSDRMR